MDFGYFFQLRIGFAEQLFRTAASPYVERKRLIESGETPFVPPYGEDGKLPFMSEWFEADASIRVIGQHCVAMLSASLKLYLDTWSKRFPAPADSKTLKGFKAGYVTGYTEYFSECLGLAGQRASIT